MKSQQNVYFNDKYSNIQSIQNFPSFDYKEQSNGSSVFLNNVDDYAQTDKQIVKGKSAASQINLVRMKDYLKKPLNTKIITIKDRKVPVPETTIVKKDDKNSQEMLTYYESKPIDKETFAYNYDGKKYFIKERELFPQSLKEMLKSSR